MSRDNTGRSDATSNSFASLGNSVVSDFDPDHEAMASTRQLDNSHRLSQINSRAGKSYREPVEEEQDFAINTSSLERAFPEFSEIQSSGEDEDISIEAGRGTAKPGHRLDDSRNSIMSFENSLRSSSPAIRLDPPTSHTPKSAPRSAPKRTVSDNLRKDAQVRRASLAHREIPEPYIPKMNRKDQRRTFSDMHARVRDNYDGSVVADERPVAVSAGARPTRFGQVNISGQVADAVERASVDARAKEGRRGKASANARNASVNGAYDTNVPGDTATNSFLLPDLPNLSELVSGVYEDGTPVFSRQNKSRTTRFVSPPNDSADVSLIRDHRPVQSIPIPEDEKALFVSLRLLQDKVAELEMAKSDAEKKVEEIRHENASLKTNRTRQKDKHGRSKNYDVEEDNYRRDNGGFVNEIRRLESANLALQNELDMADRKAQIHEDAVKRMSRERDMAVSQLGIAYVESQDLKTTNETLRQDNAELQAQVARLASLVQKYRDDDEDSIQTSSTDEVDVEDHQRSAGANRDTEDASRRSPDKSKYRENTQTRISTQVEKEISKLQKQRAEEALFTLNPSNSRRVSAPTLEKTDNRPKYDIVNAKKQPNTGKQRVKKVIVEEVDDTTQDMAAENTKKSSGAGQEDATLLSFMDAREIAKLRKTLEEERLARKQHQSATANSRAEDEIVNTTRQSSTSKPTAPRKSSLKDSKVTVTRPASATGDLTSNSKANDVNEKESNLSVPLPRQRRHSDHAAQMTPQRKQRRNAEEMTSAFILPDITISHADLAVESHATLPESTQRALDSVAGHNGKNCTVCRHSGPDGSCGHTCDPVKVPKPIPVSDRMPQVSVNNEEHTHRPSQPPAVALATVLKGLEDELSHLKMKLVAHQATYNKHDASLSKRQRKSLYGKIERLLKDIDMKSDQIYALYDVVEGQKRSINQMSEHEMEETLQSIGIDAPKTKTTNVTGTSGQRSHENVEDDSDEEDDEELPWEGFESTADVTGASRRG